MLCIAWAFYAINDGANILKKAAPLANSDADKYAAEKERQMQI